MSQNLGFRSKCQLLMMSIQTLSVCRKKSTPTNLSYCDVHIFQTRYGFGRRRGIVYFSCPLQSHRKTLCKTDDYVLSIHNKCIVVFSQLLTALQKQPKLIAVSFLELHQSNSNNRIIFFLFDIWQLFSSIALN